MKIGLVGYGNVGKAFVKLIEEKHPDWLFTFVLKSNGGILNKEGFLCKEITAHTQMLNEHKEFKEGLVYAEAIETRPDCIVELSSTNLKDGMPAYTYIRQALEQGISVITGNKGPIACHYRELKALADANHAYLGIGCTVGGALPSAISGQYSLAGAEILSIQGVLTGTTNYILNEMCQGRSYEEVLKKAQADGIAEQDPSMDVEGYDTAIKMLILTNYLMGTALKLEDIERQGITKVTKESIQRAKDNHQKIKLVGRSYKEGGAVKITVKPELVGEDSLLYAIEGKNKGVIFETDILGELAVIGGASAPRNAAAAVLRDIQLWINTKDGKEEKNNG